MKKLMAGMLATLFTVHAAQADMAAPAAVSAPSNGRILYSAGSVSGGGDVEMDQYSLLIETPDHTLVHCAGLKVDFTRLADRSRARGAAVAPEIIVAAPFIADILRPAAGQKGGTAEYGSCVPYETPVPDDVLRALREHDGAALKRLGVPPVLTAQQLVVDRASGYYMPGHTRFLLDPRRDASGDRVYSPAEIRFPDPQWQAGFEQFMPFPVYRLNGRACENTGFDQALADVRDGGPLPPVQLRQCAPG